MMSPKDNGMDAGQLRIGPTCELREVATWTELSFLAN